MGNMSLAHWLIIVSWLVLTIWYLVSTVRLLRAANHSGFMALLVLIPALGAPIVQNILAKRLGTH
jgi:uncharacterized membrane protein YhaH (DUF805 family)